MVKGGIVLKLVNLRVNHLQNPIGFHIVPLSFSWQIEEFPNGAMPAWARVRIFAGDHLVYDSGECKDADSLDFPVGFVPAPRSRYRWELTAAADDGSVAQASAWFETGKMDEEWLGRWI